MVLMVIELFSRCPRIENTKGRSTWPTKSKMSSEFRMLLALELLLC